MIVKNHDKHNAESMVAYYTDFIRMHHEYRKSIPAGLNLPKSVKTALDRIFNEAVIERERWENVLRDRYPNEEEKRD